MSVADNFSVTLRLGQELEEALALPKVLAQHEKQGQTVQPALKQPLAKVPCRSAWCTKGLQKILVRSFVAGCAGFGPVLG